MKKLSFTRSSPCWHHDFILYSPELWEVSCSIYKLSSPCLAETVLAVFILQCRNMERWLSPTPLTQVLPNGFKLRNTVNTSILLYITKQTQNSTLVAKWTGLGRESGQPQGLCRCQWGRRRGTGMNPSPWLWNYRCWMDEKRARLDTVFSKAQLPPKPGMTVADTTCAYWMWQLLS